MKRLHAGVHPGEIIREDCLPAMNVTFQQAATGTGILLDRLIDILNCRVAMTQKEAESLSAYVKKDLSATTYEIRGTADMFMRMQQDYYDDKTSTKRDLLEIVEPSQKHPEPEKVMITPKGGSPFSVHALRQWLFKHGILTKNPD